MAQSNRNIGFGDTPGYLYALWRGQIRVREGYVRKTRTYGRREGIFIYGEHDSDWVRCAAEPGKLVQGRLWISERDDAKACRLLIEYYQGNIERLEKQIEGYQTSIKILKNWEDDILDDD